MPLFTYPFRIPTAPLSDAIRVGNLVFVSGQVPIDGGGKLITGGIREQTEQVLSNLEVALAAAGARLSDVVKTTVFLTNIERDFAAMDAVYLKRLNGHKPTRSTVGVKLAIDALIEIEAIAVVGAGESAGPI